MPGTTPVYGFPYPEPTDLVADYPALGQQLAEDIEDVLPTIIGLAPATPTSIANSGGSASLSGNTVTFTGVSSVSLNGCYTGDYDNYVMSYNITSVSTALSINYRLRASGSDNSTASSYRMNLAGTSSASANTNSYVTDSNFYAGPASTSGAYTNGLVQVLRPAIAQVTTIMGHYGGSDATDTYYRMIIGHHTENVAYDGFSLFTSTGTMTGVARVYGYRK